MNKELKYDVDAVYVTDIFFVTMLYILLCEEKCELEDTNTSKSTFDDNNESVDYIVVPSIYVFPSFCTYIIYGSFVDSNNIIYLFERADLVKGSVKRRTSNRKAEM